MIHEVIPVGPLQCNCSILGDEATREAMVIDPGADVSWILALVRATNSPSSRSSSPTRTSITLAERWS